MPNLANLPQLVPMIQSEGGEGVTESEEEQLAQMYTYTNPPHPWEVGRHPPPSPGYQTSLGTRDGA
eukprot:3404570-Pyramimonas_sp.AAC.1